MDNAEKVREQRIRRAADRQGFQLTRSRRRDPRAVEYGKYWLADASNALVTPEQGMTIDEIEDFLNR